MVLLCLLLVPPNIAAILEETTIYDRREPKSMTSCSGSGDAYGATLDRIRG